MLPRFFVDEKYYIIFLIISSDVHISLNVMKKDKLLKDIITIFVLFILFWVTHEWRYF